MTDGATGAESDVLLLTPPSDGIAPYEIRCQQNPAPAEVPGFHTPGFFTNEVEHLRRQSGTFHLLTAVNQRTGRTDARCAFFVQNNVAVSPAAAPFGSVEFAEALPDVVLNDLLQKLVYAVRQTGVSALRLVHYPRCYAPQQTDRLASHLHRSGFRLIRDDATYFVPVTDEPFSQNLHPSERRRLRQCRDAGFAFAHWPAPAIDEVIQFLMETRRRQGYRLTIEPDRLTDLLRQFPDQFPVFVVRDGDALAALTVAVRVRADILYAFQPASGTDYRAFSPMVLLTDGLYAYCRQQTIRLLDLGVSLDTDGRPKPGLIRFKRNLGALTSPKWVFEKPFP